MDDPNRQETSLREEQEEEQAAKEEEDKKKAQKQIAAFRNLQECDINLENAKKIVASGVLYIHDPILDEASKDAASYVKMLMQKPF